MTAKNQKIRNASITIIGIIVLICICLAVWVYLFWGCYGLQIRHTLPHEITLSLTEDHPNRVFLRQTPYCKDERLGSVDQIILYRDGLKRVPARILAVDEKNYTVLTTEGEKTIHKNSIIGVD